MTFPHFPSSLKNAPHPPQIASVGVSVDINSCSPGKKLREVANGGGLTALALSLLALSFILAQHASAQATQPDNDGVVDSSSDLSDLPLISFGDTTADIDMNNDFDAYRVNLTESLTYRLTVTPTVATGGRLEFYTFDGRRGAPATFSTGAPLRYTATSSGIHLIRIGTGEVASGTYTLNLVATAPIVPNVDLAFAGEAVVTTTPDPIVAGVGGSISLQVQPFNGGTANMPSGRTVTVKYYIDMNGDDAISPIDAEVPGTEDTFTDGILSQQNGPRQSADILVPADLAAGDYHVGACLSSDAEPINVETNNCISTIVTIAAALSVSMPTESGGVLSYTVSNTGVEAAGGNVMRAVFRTTDNVTRPSEAVSNIESGSVDNCVGSETDFCTAVEPATITETIGATPVDLRVAVNTPADGARYFYFVCVGISFATPVCSPISAAVIVAGPELSVSMPTESGGVLSYTVSNTGVEAAGGNVMRAVFRTTDNVTRPSEAVSNIESGSVDDCVGSETDFCTAVEPATITETIGTTPVDLTVDVNTPADGARYFYFVCVGISFATPVCSPISAAVIVAGDIDLVATSVTFDGHGDGPNFEFDVGTRLQPVFTVMNNSNLLVFDTRVAWYRSLTAVVAGTPPVAGSDFLTDCPASPGGDTTAQCRVSEGLGTGGIAASGTTILNLPAFTLPETPRNDAINAGESYFYFACITQNPARFTETSPADTCTASVRVNVFPRRPDIAFAALTTPAPITVEASETTFELAFTVMNLGTANPVAGSVRFNYFRVDRGAEFFRSGQVAMSEGHDSTAFVQSATATYPVTFTDVPLPTPAAAGMFDYYICAVHSDNPNPDNDCSGAIPVNVVVAPDIRFAAINSATAISVDVGDISFDADFDIANDGTADAAANSINLSYYRSDDTTLTRETTAPFDGTGGDVRIPIPPSLMNTYAPVLAAGAEMAHDLSVPLPSLLLGSDTFSYFICLDHADDLDASNNCASGADVIVVTVNAAPITIAGTATGAVTEDGTTAQMMAGDTLTITNPNLGNDTTFVAQTATDGTYGLFGITTAGVWTYTLGGNDDNAAAVNALVAGATPTDTFTAVANADSTVTQNVVITVTGVNDLPTVVISAPTANMQVQFGADVTATGSATDPDATTLSYAWSTDPSGRGSFDAANVASTTWTAPASGTDPVALILTVTDDATTPGIGTAQVTVNPRAEPITFSGGNTGAVTEDDNSANTDTGTLVITNPGAGGAEFVPQTDAPGTYGMFSIVAGMWTYTLDNANDATNALPAGATVDDVFTVAAAADPTATHVVTITIIGANDAPTAAISAPETDMMVMTNAQITVIGTGTDPDAGETASLSYTWSTNPASIGSFADSTAASTTWTAPATGASVILNLLVSDATASATATVTVTLVAATANIDGNTEVNHLDGLVMYLSLNPVFMSLRGTERFRNELMGHLTTTEVATTQELVANAEVWRAAATTDSDVDGVDGVTHLDGLVIYLSLNPVFRSLRSTERFRNELMGHLRTSTVNTTQGLVDNANALLVP